MDNNINNNRDFSREYEELIKDMIDKKHEDNNSSKTDEEILEEVLNEYSNSNSSEPNEGELEEILNEYSNPTESVEEDNDHIDDAERTLECRNAKKDFLSFLKRSKAVLLSALVAGGIGTCAVACNSSKKDEDKNDGNNHIENEEVNFTNNQNITTASINSEGKIELSDDEIKNDSSISGDEVKNDSDTPDVNVRTVVTAKDVKEVADSYYNYLNEKVEDKSNDINMGALYSTVWIANSQFISVDETNKLIDKGLIPSDLTTLKTEVDSIMSIIISENDTKVAVSEAFKTELDIDKLISFSSIFVDETDKSISEYSEQQYLKLISSASIYADNGSIISSNQKEIFDIYEYTRNFFNSTTKYDFSEIEDSKHFRHDYPVNYAQASIGAQYLIKGIIGPKIVGYVAGTGSITDDEAIEFQEALNNEIEDQISYLNDKFNGICFDNETIKTYVK